MIRVAVVDDHAIVRNGLVALLEADRELEVVGTVGDGEAAVSCAWTSSRRGADGSVDARHRRRRGTRRIAAAAPRVQVVVLTSFVDRDGWWTRSTPAPSATC